MLRLFIEIQDSGAVQQLRKEVDELSQLLEVERRRYSQLEMKYADEIVINNELIDLCKHNKIAYREALSYAYRSNM